MHSTNIEDGEESAAPRKLQNGGKSHRKLQILTRAELDGRTTEAKQFDAIVQGIVADLGGEDRLSTVQKWLTEAFAGIALHVGDCNARLLLGELVDIVEHSQAVNTMGRIGKQIGVERRAKQIEQSCEDVILDYKQQQEAAHKAAHRDNIDDLAVTD